MKLFALLLSSSITINLFAQEKQVDTQTTDYKKLQIGVIFL